jgi:chromosome segregation ATPase
MADAKDKIEKNRSDISTLQQDVANLRSDTGAIKTNQARTDQKLDDLKDSVDAMNQKLDRLLTRGQRAQFP